MSTTTHDLPMPQHRETVTEEPDQTGDRCDPRHQDVDWIGAGNQGGGSVPDDYGWTSNPRHDRLIDHVGN